MSEHIHCDLCGKVIVPVGCSDDYSVSVAYGSRYRVSTRTVIEKAGWSWGTLWVTARGWRQKAEANLDVRTIDAHDSCVKALVDAPRADPITP